jgi:hypothetical protein
VRRQRRRFGSQLIVREQVLLVPAPQPEAKAPTLTDVDGALQTVSATILKID